jgi:type III secretion system low calcium response chaperone LcrH/SycD
MKTANINASSHTSELMDKDKKIALQINDLLMAGGTVGDTLNYTAQDYEALYCVGHGYYQEARYQDAYQVFSFLVIHNHLELRFILAFASSLQMLESWTEAIHYYSMAIAMDMLNPQPMLHVCECLIGLERFAQAREGLLLVLARSQQMDLEKMMQKAQALLEFVGDRCDVEATPATDMKAGN